MFDESEILCPYCGEPNTVFFDGSEGAQLTVTDCTVCCRPIQLDIRADQDGPGESDDADHPAYRVIARRESE